MNKTFEKEWEVIERDYYTKFNKKNINSHYYNCYNMKFVIFGVGDLGYAYAQKAKEEGYINNFVAFCDNNKTGICNIYNVPIIPLEELVENPFYDNTVVIIATMPAYAPTPTYTPSYYDDIYNQCIMMGIESYRLYKCKDNLELERFQVGDINYFKKKFFDGYKLAYEMAERPETRELILNRIKECLFIEKNDTKSNKYYQEVVEKMKYKSCRYVEDFYLRFGGSIGDNIVRFCHSRLGEIKSTMSMQKGKTPEETFSNIFSLRRKIIAENIAFSLLKNQVTDADRRFTFACSKCNMYYYNNWYGSEKDTISNIALSIYPAPCQSRCIYCNVHNNDNDRFDMKIHGEALQEILDTITYAQEKGYISSRVSYHIVSGELTIHPMKRNILRIVKNKSVQIGTNGFIFDQEIIANPYFGIYFSIDAGTAETWKKIKGVDNFKNVIKNLEKYVYSCISKEKIVLKYIIMVGINDNISDYNGVIAIMKKLEIDSLIISCNYNNSNNLKKERMNLIVATGKMCAVMKKHNIKTIISALAFSPEEYKQIRILTEDYLM